MRKKSKSRNVLLKKNSPKIDKEKIHSEAENFNEAQQVITLEKQKEKLQNDNADLNSELQNIISEKDTETQQKFGIQQELEELQREVKLSEQNNESLEQEAFDLAERTQVALISLDKRLEIAEQRQRILENAIIKIKQYQVNKTAEKRKQLDSVWSAKCQEVEESERKEEEEIRKSMNEELEEFATKLKATSDDIAKRDKEITKLKKKLHEQGLQLAAQVTSIENDIQEERREYELQMNAKLAFYKAEATKLASMNEKIVNHYKTKMKTDNKAADVEKSKLETFLQSCPAKELFQSSVSSLEEKLIEDVKNTKEWANHYSELESRKKEALSELEEGPTEISESTGIMEDD